MFPRHLFLLLFFSFLSVLSPGCSSTSIDRNTLLRLRAAVFGRTLRWNILDSSPCSWEGITCDNGTSDHHVIAIRLPGGGLKGRLPPNTIGNLTKLRVLSLRHNRISGQIPADLASCSQLTDLHLQDNSFSGEIPESFFNLTNLLRLNLAGNYFSGDLPSGFNRLTRLRTLLLEHNSFTGYLPDLHNLTNLRKFNVSFNSLSGPIPTRFSKLSAQSFIGTSLCGGSLVSCSTTELSDGAVVAINLGSVFGFVLILVISFVVWRKYKNRKFPEPKIGNSPFPPTPAKVPQAFSIQPKAVIMNDGFIFFGESAKGFTLQDLYHSSAELLGKGTVGSTYRAFLDTGIQVIVKRMKNVNLSEKEFRLKIENLGCLFHENLLPLKGYLYGSEEKLIIYEPISNQSLYTLLHGNTKQSLSWDKRTKIALTAAQGLRYLHGSTAHGNIKSSNIFLDNHHTARISEFGLTQLVSSVPNMNGYRAPEVDDTRKSSHAADVYSFGVFLLELFTGRSPDNALMGEGIKLPNWVGSIAREEWVVKKVFDAELLQNENLEEQMVLVAMLNLAILCTCEHPERRPSMVEIAKEIKRVCVDGRV